MEEARIGIAGMSCQACVNNVTAVLKAVPGVTAVEVSLARGEASVVYDPSRAGRADFQRAIEAAGFDPA